ncbi:GH25 family lysozyme [Oligoflexia bacterium]|nr:GH25 family lysozyme [Oligoflexia bacterium]
MRKVKAIVTLALAVFISTTLVNAEIHSESERKATLLEGVDVSHHNGQVDWVKVAQDGKVFVFVKATDGLDWADPMYLDNFTRLKKAGLIRGAYHFYQTNDDGKAQALWFIKNVILEPGDLPPAVDIEKIKKPLAGDVHKNFEVFVNTLEAHYRVRPIIYTGKNFWEHAMQEHFPRFQLWIAQYEVEKPTLPSAWKAWTFWQYSEKLKVAGADKLLDGNYFQGSQQDLARLLLPHQKSAAKGSQKSKSSAF